MGNKKERERKKRCEKRIDGQEEEVAIYPVSVEWIHDLSINFSFIHTKYNSMDPCCNTLSLFFHRFHLSLIFTLWIVAASATVLLGIFISLGIDGGPRLERYFKFFLVFLLFFPFFSRHLSITHTSFSLALTFSLPSRSVHFSVTSSPAPTDSLSLLYKRSGKS